jgi:hypothetical protein
MRKNAAFTMAADGIETIGVYKRAARAAMKAGAVTVAGIQKAIDGTMGAFKADYLTVRTAVIRMVAEGDAIMRDNGEFALI